MVPENVLLEMSNSSASFMLNCSTHGFLLKIKENMDFKPSLLCQEWCSPEYL